MLLPVAEITFRTECAAEAIKLLREARPDMLVGAGTVINREQVRQAKAAGAQFVVSPGLNPNTVQACQQIDIPIVPGINNPSAVEQALELGIDFVKFFPAEPSGGIPMIKAMLAPYHQLQVMPTAAAACWISVLICRGRMSDIRCVLLWPGGRRVTMTV